MRKRHSNSNGLLKAGKVLLSVEEAASVMSLGRSLVYDLVMRREIASIKVGRMRRIPVFALQDFVNKQLVLNGEEA
jgi:excisionase family DNA binding protein